MNDKKLQKLKERLIELKNELRVTKEIAFKAELSAIIEVRIDTLLEQVNWLEKLTRSLGPVKFDSYKTLRGTKIIQ